MTDETTQEIPITEPPKPKRGWPKGKKRGPRKPREPQSAPELPVEAPTRAEVVAASRPMPRKPRKARKPRYPVTLIVGKKRYHGNEIEFQFPWALVHDNKGHEMVRVAGEFRVEGQDLTFKKPEPAERGYDAPPLPFPVTGTTSAVAPRFVNNTTDHEAEVRRHKESVRRELESLQGPEAFG